MNIKNSKCIYFGNTNIQLSYNKQEHVIPASLGGKIKLPKGVVSDQANELFSSRELKAVRNTFLAINRNNNGPGKRGSFSVKKVKSPQINVFEVVSNKHDLQLDTVLAPIRLGFLFCGKVHMIPQILFLINDDWSIKLPRIVADTISENAISSSMSFRSKLSDFIFDKNRTFIWVNSQIKTKEKYIILGLHNKKWFVSTSFGENFPRKFFRLLEKFPLPEKILVLQTTIAKYHYNNQMQDILDDSLPFIYIKTAFNTLAFFTESNFVLQSNFDDVRKAIIDAKNLKNFFIEKPIPKWLIEWVNTHVKPKAHFVIINAENHIVEAYVSFYREPLTCSICLSKNYSGKNFRNYFVCNYMDNTEYYF